MLKKPFWNYKDISNYYQVCYSTAIKYKKEALKEFSSSEAKGINAHNSDLINSDWVLRKVSKKQRIDKIKEFEKLLDVYENYGSKKGVIWN